MKKIYRQISVAAAEMVAYAAIGGSIAVEVGIATAFEISAATAEPVDEPVAFEATAGRPHL